MRPLGPALLFRRMQDYEIPPHDTTELAAAFLQAGILVGLIGVCVYLYVRYRKPYFALWGLAWGLYALRLGAIISFLIGEQRGWLYWHQVLTGWTALAFLWAALVFSEQVPWRHRYWALVVFPPLWSYLAIYRLDNFLLAAGPAVLFLSGATLWTGAVLWRHHRRLGSLPAALTAAAFFLWSLHHLDYPFLRARGAWNPWGYYLDIVFLLAIGAGILLLVVEDQDRGLSVLSSLSGDLQSGAGEEDVLDALLARPLTLPAVQGAAMYFLRSGTIVRGTGTCAAWTGRVPAGGAEVAIARVVESGEPEVLRDWPGEDGAGAQAYTAALPIFRADAIQGALVVVGDARDPFAVLDTRFLVALGHQVGAALANVDLYRRLEERSADLARLARRMVHQHEEERRRLSRELHDESAQVFAAVKLQLGIARESADERLRPVLDRATELVGSGIRTIREVARHLRPSLLDDLGLLPALRALAGDFSERSGLPVAVVAPADLPPLSGAAELALFRALQEGLSNVARHARAARVEVEIAVERDGASDGAVARVRLAVRDDGVGPPPGDPVRIGEGHMGIAGMRERVLALGGSVRLVPRPEGGTGLEVRVPAEMAAEAPA
ncbi:MAG: GAF domain-containing sensor histidine kinase [Gemmatimonadota bacterium]|nr:GAF domain-containing sensor histidine kinase [Gemmatimonadota bacterium]